MKTDSISPDPWCHLPPPEDYFQGLRTPYPCPVDNLLGFTRRSGHELTGNRPEEHQHPRWVWILARSGNAINVIRGRTLILEAKEMLLIPGRIPHYHQALPEDVLDWCFLTFECQQLEWAERLGEKILRPDPQEAALFDEVITCVLKGRAAEAALTLCLFHERLSRSQQGPPDPQDAWVSRIRNWAMQSQVSTTIAALAKYMGGSESHLRQRFRDTTGLSLGRYLMHLRIVRAAEWLHDPQLSITEIAYRSGYESPGNFSRAFQREMNLSPRQYRKDVMADNHTSSS